MDERLGRKLAARHGLKVTGLLGLLVMARQKNLIEEVRPLIHEIVCESSVYSQPYGLKLRQPLLMAALERTLPAAVWR